MDKKKKITFNAHPDIWERATEFFGGLPISRDHLVGITIEKELPRIEKTLKRRGRQSSQVEDFISERVRLFKPRPANISLPERVVEKLDGLKKEYGLNRDQFINRVLYFLLAGPKMIDRLSQRELRVDFALEDALLEDAYLLPSAFIKRLADPFERLHKELFDPDGNQTSLYEVPIAQPFRELICFAEEDEIPGTKEHKYLKDMWD